MSQPTAYNRQYDFTGFSASQPSDQQPGTQLDAEFNAIKATTDQIRTNLQLVQRDDGALKNNIVTLDTLDPATVAFFTATNWILKGAWVTLTAYVALDVVTVSGATYICTTSHTGGVFATDLAAGKWITIYNPIGATPADGSVTTTKIADGAVTAAKLGFTSLDLSGSLRGATGLAAGNAVAGTHLVYAKAAAGDVRSVMERTTRAQGAVGYRWIGGTAGYTYELVQDASADTLSFRLVGGADICAFQTDGRADWSNTQRVVGGAASPASGSGLEWLYTGGSGIIQAYNRTGAAWLPLAIKASALTLAIGGVTIATVSATGGDWTELSINGVLVGYRGVPQNAQNGNYTLVATDAGKHIYSKNVGAQTITLPLNASVAYVIGTAIQIINNGTTAIAIATGGTTLIWAGVGSTGVRTLAVKGLCTIEKVESDTWFISGAGLS
jgi:hypothetical protein